MKLSEEIAIIIAEGNNGGKWATHYTEEQKEMWRARARKIISIVLETLG